MRRMPALISGSAALILAGAAPAAASVQQVATTVAPVVFDKVTVVDVEHGKLIPDQRVVITGNRIKTVGDVGAVKTPKGAQVVDAQGKYLIPGFWDMDVGAKPMAYRTYPLLLANGVTGIRVYAPEASLDSLVLWRRKTLDGTIAGPPRQLLASPSIDDKPACRRVDETWRHTCVRTDDTADVRHLVDSLRARGADIIGTYNVSRSTSFMIAREARRRGLPMAGQSYHVPLAEASDSGFAILNYPNLNAELGTPCLYGDASVEQCRPLAERLRRNGTWWVPDWLALLIGTAYTKSIYYSYGTFAHDFWADSTSNRSLYDYVHQAIDSHPPHSVSPIAMITAFNPLPPRGGTNPDSAGYLYVARLAGLPIMAGSETILGSFGDDLPGSSLHIELAAYAAEGLTPLEALQTATLNPAKFLRGTDSLGTVAAGKLADLVLLDANPLADITNTMRIRAVVANGRYFDRAALDKLVAEVQAKAKRP